jgi:uncharacterized protein
VHTNPNGSQGSVAGPRAHSPQVWLVIGEKLGDNAQIEIVADTLAWPTLRKVLRFKPQYATGKPPFKPSLYHIDLSASDPLTPPWPDLVLTVGRRPSMAAMWIKQQSEGRSKVVIVGRPRRMLRDFDLVVATPQYRLPDRDNVLRVELPLMRVDPRKIEAGVAAWRDRLSALARPLTAVLIGGPTKPFVFDSAVANTFMAALRRTTRNEGTLFITTSRRTPPDVVDALAADLPPGAELFRWQPDAADNPYQGLLGLDDRFVVTGDSISMLVEVARVGKPLALFALPTKSGAWPMVKKRLARVFQPAIAGGKNGPLVRIGDILYDFGIIGYSREFEAVHRALIDGGFAVLLGQPFATSVGEATDDVPRVVTRIRSLFNAE